MQFDELQLLKNTGNGAGAIGVARKWRGLLCSSAGGRQNMRGSHNVVPFMKTYSELLP